MRYTSRGLPLILFALAACAYLPSLRVPLMFDDAGAVVTNVSIRNLGTSLVPPADGSTTTGRPVLNFIYALNRLATGDTLWGWHLGNLLLHGVATVLAYLCLRRLASTIQGVSVESAEAVAFGGSLLWSIHPLNTESVVSVAQRSELLFSVLFLGAIWFFLRCAVSGNGRWRDRTGLIACAIAGMAAKEVMVVLPAILFLVDRTFVAGSFAQAWRQRGRLHLAVCSTWLVLAAVLWQAGGSRGKSAGLGLAIGPWEYLLKQAEANWHYLRLVVWPHPLVVDYGFGVPRSLGEVWLPGAAVLLILSGVCWGMVRWPKSTFAGAWWFVLLSPSSSFVPLVSQTMAEHRLYLPLLGPLGLLAFLGAKWSPARRGVVWGALGVVLLTLTVARQWDYRSPEALWMQTVRAYPDSARAHLNLGTELLAQQRYPEARDSFAEALRRAPGYALACYNEGISWQAEGNWEKAERAYARGVALAPQGPDLRVNHGVALAELGRLHEAVAEFRAALALEPAVDTRGNLGLVLLRLGSDDEGLLLLDEAARDLHVSPAILSQAANWAARKQRWTEAERFFVRLVELSPTDFSARANLGNIYLLTQRPGLAVGCYRAALALRPGDPRIEANLRLAEAALH